MALTTEETYIDVEMARDYADTFALVLPDDDAELEALLRRSAIYLDRIYGQRYLGVPADVQQLLFWPRDVHDGLIPAALGQAQVELAAVIYANDGVLPPVPPRVKKIATKLEGLETSIEYADVTGYSASPYAGVEAILTPYFKVETTDGVALKPRLTMTRGG